jgi:hypothetical protein
MTVSTLDKLHCASRELALRRQQIASGRMSAQQAAHEIAAMEAIVADYREAVRAPDLFTGAQKEGQSDER